MSGSVRMFADYCYSIGINCLSMLFVFRRTVPLVSIIEGYRNHEESHGQDDVAAHSEDTGAPHQASALPRAAQQ